MAGKLREHLDVKPKNFLQVASLQTNIGYCEDHIGQLISKVPYYIVRNLLSEFADTTALVPLLASWFSWTAHRFVPVQSWTSQGSHVRQSRRPRPVCSSPFGVQSVSCPTGVISRNGFCAIPLISAHTHGHAYSAILCFSSFWPISRTSSAGTQKGRSRCRVSVISSK